jgi:2-polyprenyl-6-methoxyphenol hydroxylase-like FAD-dependent oxidoreductase
MQQEFDVAIVGYGPVGQTAAILLGQLGYSVGVFERWPGPYRYPRAVSFDHEIMRIFQSIGCAEKLQPILYPNKRYDWLNAEGKLLVSFDLSGPTPSGWSAAYLWYQPELEEILDQTAQALPNVQIYRGWKAVELAQFEDRVELTVAQQEADNTSTTLSTVRAKYLVGADGANSFVRQNCGIGCEDLGFEADWLVIDFLPHDPEREFIKGDAFQLCDPARPTTIVRGGPRHLRWEFMRLPGESLEELETQETAWQLLSKWVTPQDGELVRYTVYTFRSLLVDQWRVGRILLAGDAAHRMPPFMGQGMSSGVRDAINLAWKLNLILQGKAPDSLLDSYMEERKPHVTQVIQLSMAMGRIVCVTDANEAAARDQFFLSGQAPQPALVSGLTAGVLYRNSSGVVTAPAGQLGIQSQIAYRGQTGRADDLLGAGWSLLCWQADPHPVLNPEQLAFLNHLGAKIVRVVPSQTPVPGDNAALDLTGTYARYFSQQGLAAVLVRPDFYVFGGVPTLSELAYLVEDLRSQLAMNPAALHR